MDQTSLSPRSTISRPDLSAAAVQRTTQVNTFQMKNMQYLLVKCLGEKMKIPCDPRRNPFIQACVLKAFLHAETKSTA